MDDKKFKEMLTQVCEWTIPFIGLNGGPAKPSLKKTKIEIVTDEFGEEQEIEVLEDGPNETLPPRIKSIFPITQPCENCNRVITDRRVTYRRVDSLGPRPVWKIKCTACKNHRNPWTGEFNVEPDQVGRVFSAWSHETDHTEEYNPDSIIAALKAPSTKY